VTIEIDAQETGSLPGIDSLPQQILGEVVVTASRYSSFQVKTPEAIRLIDSKSIEKFQVRTAPEALMATPGVFVQKTNHGGGSPFLRGLTGNQTLLLVDGIRLSNAIVRYGPNQYFNTIDVFSIEKMEVLRGNGSVQYGSDAIGGTIQAFSHEVTTSENPEWGSSFLTRIATHGMEQSLIGSVNFSNKKFAVRAGATWRNFGDLVGGDTTGRQSPTGYRELDFDIKSRILLSSSSDLTIAYQRVHQSDVPVFHKVILENYAVNKMEPQKRQLAYIKLNQKLDEGILKSAVITASYQNNEEGRELLKNGSSSLRTENDEVNSFALTAEVLTSNEKGWTSDTGLEVYNDLVSSSRTDKDLTTGVSVSKRGLYPDGATMTSFAAFSMHTLDMKNWSLTAGARFNTYITKVEDENVGLAKLKPSALVGSLALLRKLNKSSNLFVSMNTGFRAPNIDDLGTLGIVDFRYETPNFDLKPEHSFQYQIGYKYQDRKLRGEIFIYRNELYNLIVRNKIAGDTIEGYPVYKKENVERAYIQGVETAWDIDLNKSWMFSGNLTYAYGQNITRDEPVRRIPPLFGRFSVEYKYKSWWMNLEWQAAGRQDRLAAGDIDDNRIPDGGTPGWNIFNISTGYSWRFIKINVSLLNLLNQDYRFHGSGVNGYGRSGFLSVILSI
jgi:outer membrane cobalamin receptor